MAKQLGKFEKYVQDTSGNAVSGATVTIYREGATFQSGSGTSPATLTVRNNGKIVASDTVFINTTTGTTYSVDSVTDTTVVVSGFAGTLSPTALDRIIPNNNRPDIHADDQGGTSAITDSELTSSATGLAEAWTAERVVDYIVTNGTALTLTSGHVISTQAPGQVRFADDFTQGTSTGGIQEAYDDLPSTGGHVELSGNTTYSITAALAPPANSSIGGAGASTILNKAFNGNIFEVGAANVTIADMLMEGNQATRTGSGVSITATSGADCIVRDNVIQNMATYGVLNNGAPRVKVLHNKVTGCINIGIHQINDSQDCLVEGNYVDASSATAVGGSIAITAYSTTGGKAVHNNRIIGNHTISGIDGSGNGANIVVGAFSGDTPHGIIIANNICVAGQNNGSGGYLSVALATDCTVANNLVEVNGKTGSVGIELAANCTTCTVTGNVVRGGTTLNTPIVVDDCTECTVVGNTVNGFGGATKTGITLAANSASDVCSRNVVSGNTIIFPAATASALGIQIIANNAAGAADYNIIANNRITGNGSATTDGIKVFENSASATANSIIGNFISSVTNGVTLGSSDITDTYVKDNQFISVTTPLNGFDQVVTAVGDTIGGRCQNILYLTADASYTITSTPTVADGFDGQELLIVNQDATDTITIQDQGTLGSSNLRLSANTIALAPRDSITIRYNKVIGDWIQVGQVNVL